MAKPQQKETYCKSQQLNMVTMSQQCCRVPSSDHYTANQEYVSPCPSQASLSCLRTLQSSQKAEVIMQPQTVAEPENVDSLHPLYPSLSSLS